MSLDAAELKRLSSLLDLGLDVAPEQREAWLDALTGEDARLSPVLRRMLAGSAGADSTDPLGRVPSFTALGPASPGSAGFAVGDRVGPYGLLRELGAGGMGEVWLAERSDGQLKRQVALKLPLLGLRRSVLVQRFARERDILGGLAHPHIARLYDAGLDEDGQPYLALEYVEGEPITRYCQERRLGLRERIAVLRQVMDAVQYAHAHLVIHRDLKPGNVLVTAAGQAMLLDFGIAKLLQDEQTESGETELTRLGGRALTLSYAGPEQVAGAPVSIATDIWALGVLMFELLTGERPFRGERRELEQAILHNDPPRLRDVPADLATIALKALRKAPAERYPTVSAMADDLDRWLRGEPVLAQGDSRGYRLRKFVARHRLPVAVGVSVALIVVAASVVSVWQAMVAREQTRIAVNEARTAQAVQSFLEGIFKASSGDQADPVKARSRTALELLDEGAARIGRELENAPLARLRLLKTLSDMYRDMGQLDRRSTLLDERAALAAAVHGADSGAAVAALADAGFAAEEAARPERARSALTQAEAASGALRDPETRLAVDLALAAYHNARGEGAGLAAAQRAVDMLRRRPPSMDRLNALYLLGSMEFYSGHHEASAAAYREGIALAPRLEGGGASMLASLHAELADTEDRLGRPDEAIAQYRQALALSERNQGPTGRDTFVLQKRIGAYLTSHGRLRDALLSFAQARRILAAWPESADKARSLPNLLGEEARTTLAYGRPEAAIALLDAAIAASVDKAVPPGQMALHHMYRARARGQLGQSGQAAADFAAAEELVHRHGIKAGRIVNALAQFRITDHLVGGRNAEAAAAWLRLREGEGADPRGLYPVDIAAFDAEIALVSGRATEAVAHARRAVAILKSGPDERSPDEARVQHLLGTALLADGQLAAALPELQRNVALREALFDPEASPGLAAALVALGEAQRQSGRLAEARTLLARAEAIHAVHKSLARQYVEPLRRLQAALRG
ncbi:MAG: serine/threonine-protein kinase [Caldimonas sp.]